MRTGSDIAFVSPPFFPAYCANYAVEYLASICAREGLKVETHHLHHEFGADLLKAGFTELYDALKSRRYLGDLLVLARWEPSRAARIMTEIPQVVSEYPNLDVETLRGFFAVWNGVHSEFLQKLLQFPPRVLALSATHYQLVASLWLAQEIRRATPDVKIILGGYLGEMETCRDLLDGHDALDAIVYGEGDQVVVDTVRDMVSGRGGRHLIKGKRTIKLRTIPNYDEYMQRLKNRGDEIHLASANYELSRGCYWDKCDFCNFNVAYGRFRSFKSQSILDEMERLAQKWNLRRFHFLDTSLPPSFARQCHGRGDSNWDVFVEIMVDWNIEQLLALRSFGVKRAQVGIESFSDDHLVSMNKGRTVEQNATVLSACRAADVKPVYGLLVGRPGDTPEHYFESTQFAMQNNHLPPPRYLSDCDLRPGSPIYRRRQELGANIRFVGRAFDKVLPDSDHNCELRPSRVTWEVLNRDDLRAARAELEQAVTEWQSQHTR